MYDYIKGILTNKTTNTKGAFCTVETSGGIGFLLEITDRDYKNLPQNDEPTKLYTVLIHREDKMSLCGFLKHENRDIFNILTSVSGVGSKMALVLLNEFDTSELISFVIDENFRELTRAKGVGTKLAQKIVLELKDKLINYQEVEPIKLTSSDIQNQQALEDAQAVLSSLGYEKEEIKTAITKALSLLKTDATAEAILKETLKILSV